MTSKQSSRGCEDPRSSLRTAITCADTIIVSVHGCDPLPGGADAKALGDPRPLSCAHGEAAQLGGVHPP